MPASKKPAVKRVVRDDDKAVPASKVAPKQDEVKDEPKVERPVESVEAPVSPVTQEPALPERVEDLVPAVKSDAVTFAKNKLTVDLTALEALPQGKRQAAVKVARSVLDRASQ